MRFSQFHLCLSAILLVCQVITFPRGAFGISEQCENLEDVALDSPELVEIHSMLELLTEPKCSNCVDNRGGEIPGTAPSGGTYDKCIVAGTGNVCNPEEAGGNFLQKKCCDFTGPDKTQCACNTLIAGPCPTNQNACLCCMMLAESQGESSNACKRAVGCVIKKRAQESGKSICESNTQKFGNTPSFTSDKAICDKYADEEGSQIYNQVYRTCREAICNGGQNNGTYTGCSDMLGIMQGAQCPDIDTFQVGPCPAGCTTVPIPSNPACQHTFCKCAKKKKVTAAQAEGSTTFSERLDAFGEEIAAGE